MLVKSAHCYQFAGPWIPFISEVEVADLGSTGSELPTTCIELEIIKRRMGSVPGIGAGDRLAATKPDIGICVEFVGQYVNAGQEIRHPGIDVAFIPIFGACRSVDREIFHPNTIDYTPFFREPVIEQRYPAFMMVLPCNGSELPMMSSPELNRLRCGSKVFRQRSGRKATGGYHYQGVLEQKQAAVGSNGL